MRIVKDWIAKYQRHVLEVDHELRDGKQRRIGGMAIIEDRRGLNPPPDQSFELEIKTLRDGRQFGALRPSTSFSDLDEAKREAMKRLARQGKGLAKAHP